MALVVITPVLLSWNNVRSLHSSYADVPRASYADVPPPRTIDHAAIDSVWAQRQPNNDGAHVQRTCQQSPCGRRQAYIIA